MSNTTRQHESLIRSELWSNLLKDFVMDETMAKGYVEWVSDEFTDGTMLTRPIIGDLDVNDYVEDEAVKYMPLDSGEFNFEITEYKSSATYITEKARLDGYYMSQLESSFVPRMNRAIMNDMEAFIMKQGQPVTGGKPHAQVANDANRINGAAHRWVAGDLLDGRRVLGPRDFAKANLSFNKMNIPTANRMAIVDSSTAFVLETATNLVNVSDNPMYEGIITQGLSDGKRFVRNIYGFDVYTSEYLPRAGVDGNGAIETIDGVALTAEGAQTNLFFSATADMLPWIGAWRQQPKVDGEWNKDFQRQEYVTTAYYGAAPQNRHNLITVLSDDILDVI